MATTRPRVFEYAVTLDRDWAAASDRGGSPLPHEREAWTPEHLLLAALARCSLTSLRYHAGRAGVESDARADARGTVTLRAEDGRFAFVDIAVDADVTLEPPLDTDAVLQLLAKAERDCFIGASLTSKPRYRWTVNGEEIA